MQQIKDLEARLDQLANENRLLASAKITAEQQLQDAHFTQSREENASTEALEMRDTQLREKDMAIEQLRSSLDTMQQEVARLTDVNESFQGQHRDLADTHEERYSQLAQEHAQTREQWEQTTRELQDVRSQHKELSTGMEDIVQHELNVRLAEKDAEIVNLQKQLQTAQVRIETLQNQIMDGQVDDVIEVQDDEYFENACEELCKHVQQWVLRFSKFSDTRICRLTRDIKDEQIADAYDNAILDATDVDDYLSDRVKRRDVFMSVVMQVIFEHVFQRYLFGMDREQRQKIKTIEKNLTEVGPPGAVHRWRAMTLTLLSKRNAFQEQRKDDTEAVAQEIYRKLVKLLPPPQELKEQIMGSLKNVLNNAVDLSIKMRTQLPQYMMLPPLQPEYDTQGELVQKVYFNPTLMNERSGNFTSNEELAEQHAVVRMVLFPVVLKKGDDLGEGEDEIVICPGQVLVATPKDKRVNRVASGASGTDRPASRMSIDQKTNRSQASIMMSGMDPNNVI